MKRITPALLSILLGIFMIGLSADVRADTLKGAITEVKIVPFNDYDSTARSGLTCKAKMKRSSGDIVNIRVSSTFNGSLMLCNFFFNAVGYDVEVITKEEILIQQTAHIKLHTTKVSAAIRNPPIEWTWTPLIDLGNGVPYTSPEVQVSTMSVHLADLEMGNNCLFGFVSQDKGGFAGRIFLSDFPKDHPNYEKYRAHKLEKIALCNYLFNAFGGGYKIQIEAFGPSKAGSPSEVLIYRVMRKQEPLETPEPVIEAEVPEQPELVIEQPRTVEQPEIEEELEPVPEKGLLDKIKDLFREEKAESLQIEAGEEMEKIKCLRAQQEYEQLLQECPPSQPGCADKITAACRRAAKLCGGIKPACPAFP